jgi:glycosyltransferase involved in cell wall biosynthesis
MAAPRVLIDGYNLAMKHGTGIKTYTMLLDNALKSLGAQTSFLFGHAIPSVSDPLLREVLFYDDNPTRYHTPFGRIRHKAGLWGCAALDKAPPISRIPDNDVVIMAQAKGSRPHERALNGQNLYDIGWRRSLSFGKFLDASAPETFDAVHMTFPLPVRLKGNAKKIVTIHDLIPLRLPYTTTDDKTEMLRRHRIAAAEADLIFTVSEFSKSDIVKLLNVDPDKIVVTYQPSRFAPIRPPEMRERAKTLRRFELVEKGYVLFVGAIEPKKNLGRLLKAYVEADVEIPIVVVGPRGWMWNEEIGWIIDSVDPGVRRKVRFLNHLSPEELRYVYSGALATTFPSLYEGYGLPLIESMSFGVPVLTSRSSSLPEVCGDAALYVDPFDVRDIREKIERLVGDAPLRDYLSERGLQRAQELSPANFAEQVAGGYRRLGLLE